MNHEPSVIGTLLAHIAALEDELAEIKAEWEWTTRFEHRPAYATRYSASALSGV